MAAARPDLAIRQLQVLLNALDHRTATWRHVEGSFSCACVDAEVVDTSGKHLKNSQFSHFRSLYGAYRAWV